MDARREITSNGYRIYHTVTTEMSYRMRQLKYIFHRRSFSHCSTTHSIHCPEPILAQFCDIRLILLPTTTRCNFECCAMCCYELSNEVDANTTKVLSSVTVSQCHRMLIHATLNIESGNASNGCYSFNLLVRTPKR